MKNSLSLLVILILVNSSCKKDNCAETKAALVMSVEAPEYGVINENISIEVRYLVTNESGQFDKFIVSNSENSYNINVMASYSGCDHLALAPMITTNYTFNTPTPGTYFLNFTTDNDNYIRDTIIVN